MAMAYYQCPKCRRPTRSKYSGGPKNRPQIWCSCDTSENKLGVLMTYRGDGWDGRENWPHGSPPKQQTSELDQQIIAEMNKSDAAPVADAVAEAQRLVDEGYQQVSRKFRMLARVPPGQTAKDALYAVVMKAYEKLPNEAQWAKDTRKWVDNLGERACRDQYCRVYAESITVSWSVFNEFLRLKKD